MTLVESIAHLHPCAEAVSWLASYTDAERAWAECPKPQWMLWLIGQYERSEAWSDERKPLLACALDCAETVGHLWCEKQRAEIESAIKTLREWIIGQATTDQAKTARKVLYAADAYATDAAYAYAANATDAVAYAVAYAVANATDAVAYAYAANAAYAYAANAVNAAANADAANAYAAGRKQAENRCAGIVRRHFPRPPKIEGIGGPK